MSELTKDDLIYTLLRSEKVPQENNCLKYINSVTNSNLRDRINHATMMIAKLGNILTNIERHKIRKELYDMENTKYKKASHERAVIRLVELTNDLYYKQKQHSSRHHDQTYFGTKDIEHLYNDKIDYYYEPILVRSSFENNFEEYEIRGDKWKNLSLKEYLAVIMPQLTELIDKKKRSTQDKQKIQLIIAAIFRHITEPSKKYTIYAKSRNIEMRAGDDTNGIVIKLLDTFLENYERGQTYYEIEVAMCLNVSILHLYNFIK